MSEQMDKLSQALEALERKQDVLLEKAADGANRAIQCLARKKTYEKQIEKLRNYQSRIRDLIILLEGARAWAEAVGALRTGAAAMIMLNQILYESSQTLDKLRQTLEVLESKENILLEKAAKEPDRAIQCLKRKKSYEQIIERLRNYQLRIHDKMILLQGASARMKTVAALTGAAAMEAIQK